MLIYFPREVELLIGENRLEKGCTGSRSECSTGPHIRELCAPGTASHCACWDHGFVQDSGGLSISVIKGGALSCHAEELGFYLEGCREALKNFIISVDFQSLVGSIFLQILKTKLSKVLPENTNQIQ